MFYLCLMLALALPQERQARVKLYTLHNKSISWKEYRAIPQVRLGSKYSGLGTIQPYPPSYRTIIGEFFNHTEDQTVIYYNQLTPYNKVVTQGIGVYWFPFLLRDQPLGRMTR